MSEFQAEIPLTVAFEGFMDRARHHGALATMSKEAVLLKKADEVFEDAVRRDGYVETVIEDLQNIGMGDEAIEEYLSKKVAFVGALAGGAARLGGKLMGRLAGKALRPAKALGTAAKAARSWAGPKAAATWIGVGTGANMLLGKQNLGTAFKGSIGISPKPGMR